VSNACGNATSDDAALAVFASGSGDVNGDALLNGIDVSTFVTAILSAGPPSAGYCAADMNADGAVTPADVPLFAAALVGP